MTGPFSVLGIAADADEQAIKTAYAKLLKLTRPDDDPEGFQRLNQAYRQALKVAQSRKTGTAVHRSAAFSQPITLTLNLTPNAAAGTIPRATRVEEPVHARPSRPSPILARPPPEPAAPRPQRPAFDPQAFLAEYRHVANSGGAKALSRWLMDYPAFWHLPTKHAAGQWLLRALFESPEVMPKRCFTATSEFFHYEDAISGADPLALRRVGARIDAMSLVKPENVRDLALHALRNSGWSSRRICLRAIKRMSRPFRWWRDLPHALRPRATRTLATIASALCNGNPGDLPPPLNRDHARFWMDACDPAKPRRRQLLALFRSVVALVLIPLACAVLFWLVQLGSHGAEFWHAEFGVWGITSGLVAFAVSLYWVPVGGRAIVRKADALAMHSCAVRLLMASLTPLLCALAVLMTMIGDPAPGTVFAVAIMFIAVWRARRAHGTGRKIPLRLGLGCAYAIALIAVSAASSMPVKSNLLPPLAISVITVGVWAFDWYKRGFLRPRTPRPMRTKLRRSSAA